VRRQHQHHTEVKRHPVVTAPHQQEDGHGCENEHGKDVQPDPEECLEIFRQAAFDEHLPDLGRDRCAARERVRNPGNHDGPDQKNQDDVGASYGNSIRVGQAGE
jgi:hypothetical protein